MLTASETSAMIAPTTLHVLTTVTDASEKYRQVLVIRNKHDAFSFLCSGTRVDPLKLVSNLAKNGWIEGSPFVRTENGLSLATPLVDFLAAQDITLINCDENPEDREEIMALFDSIKAKNAK